MIDCHAHLHTSPFDTDREQAIKRAFDAGVKTLINVGFDVEGNYKSCVLARQYDTMYATIGIHPHGVDEWNSDVEQGMRELLKREEKIIALGEMGLDYFKNLQPRELQISVFQAQLKLADEFDLPVIIHCRDAFDDLFEILRKFSNIRVLLHCFTGTLEHARYAWEKGYYTAFTAIITYPSAVSLREIVAIAPLDKIVIETDCPYLAPQKYRGQRNEPAFLFEVLAEISRVKNIDIPSLEKGLAENTKRLFGI